MQHNNIIFNNSWSQPLEAEINSSYFETIINKVNTQYAQYVCYPQKENIFRAFELCHYNNLKAVIIGQDPYHEPNQAHGLSFSVPTNVPMPPSLINIFKEIENQTGKPMPTNGNLERWAKQGVLLLNASLTVQQHLAHSHKNIGWNKFTDAVIATISKNKTNIVFLLWGAFARQKAKLINTQQHLVLECNHPSPLSANRGGWFGNNHFIKTNNYLVEHNKTAIEW